MSEAEWLTCADPVPMLEFIRAKVSDRKLRLYACACTRRYWDLLRTPSRRAVDAVERFADGLPVRKGLAHIGQVSTTACHLASPTGAEAAVRATHWGIAAETQNRLGPTRGTGWEEVRLVEDEEAIRRHFRRMYALILRDVTGGIFHPQAFSPSWLTRTVIALAQTIYEERAFDRVPILCDALEDAGCANQEILSHCRGSGPHVRGCWVLDVLLGKE